MDKYYLKYGERLKNDKEIILSVSKNYDKALAYADPEILSDEVFILNAVNINGSSLNFANTSFRDNEKIVLTAVKQKWKALKYASDRLKDNETIVLEAINGNGNAIRYASDNLKNNRNLVLAAVKNKAALDYIPHKFLNEDTEIISELVNRKFESKYSLEFASEEIKNNRELVLKIVQNNGLNLAFVGDEFKKDMEIVNAAAFQNFMSLSYSDLSFEELTPIILQNLRNRNFLEKNKHKNIDLNFNKFSVLASIRKHIHIFYNVGDKYRSDKEFMLLAIDLNPISYYYVNNDLKLDRDIIMKFLGRYDSNSNLIHKYILQFCNYFKNDLELLKKLSYASDLELNILLNYEEYINAKTLMGKWFCKLDDDMLKKLNKCKNLFYPGALYDFSTIQFFIENSSVNNFYYSDYMNTEINPFILMRELENWFIKWGYTVTQQEDLFPSDFKQKSWDPFWYDDPEARFGSDEALSFCVKFVIEKDGRVWNLFYFGTEGIATYDVLLKNKINLDVIVTQNHGLGGCWCSFTENSLLERVAVENKNLPKLMLSGDQGWSGYEECSDFFGKFGMHNGARKLYYHKK